MRLRLAAELADQGLDRGDVRWQTPAIEKDVGCSDLGEGPQSVPDDRDRADGGEVRDKLRRNGTASRGEIALPAELREPPAASEDL
ncbi:MAG: hypothetical protein QOG89_1900, partial [Thermomicrobiales bacterium]|nr:hypothetical protein [Thermomicrobiales bacterium]